MVDLAAEAIVENLSKTFQDDRVERIDYGVHPYSTSSEDRDPSGYFHLDNFLYGLSDYPDYDQYNYWIPLKDVEGRPISFVKSDSTEQKRDPGDDDLQYFDHDLEPADMNKFFYIPGMKKRQLAVFEGTESWHGSPVLEHPHDGERESMLIIVVVKRTKEVIEENEDQQSSVQFNSDLALDCSNCLDSSQWINHLSCCNRFSKKSKRTNTFP